MTRLSRPTEVLRRQLLDHLESLGDDLIAELWAEISRSAPYRGLGEVERDEVATGSVAWTFKTFSECLRDGRSLTVSEIDHLRAVGGQRAGQGAPVAAVEEAFFLALGRCSRELTRVARQWGDQEALIVLGDLLNELGPLSRQAWKAIEEGFRRETRRMGGMEGGLDRTVAVRALIEGSDDERAVLAGLGWGSGMDCLLVLVFQAREAFTPDLQSHVRAIAGVLPNGVSGPVWSSPVPYGVALASCPGGLADAVWRAVVMIAEERQCRIVVSDPIQASAVGRIHRWLHREIETVSAVAGEPGVVGLHAVARELSTATTSLEFAEWQIREVLGPVLGLRADLAKPLLETLLVMERPGRDVRSAATELCLSEPGVRDRLERIKQLTGLSYRRPGDAWLLLQTLRLYQRHRDRLPPLGDARWT